MPTPTQNPVLLERWRGAFVESVHRGSWVVTDSTGAIVDGQGAKRAPVFARSSTKSMQALALIETGAADAHGYSDADLALALASHSGEAKHTDRVAQILARLELDHNALGCGSAAPTDSATRRALFAAGATPTALHHNCSGKHAGFLTLARHLGVAPADYIDPESKSQQHVRQAMLDVCALGDDELAVAVDGCSAPTFRLPLDKLAQGIARITTPDDLGPTRANACRRMTAAAAQHPDLIAGSKGRLCTDLSRVTRGRLFPKVGAEAIYVVGVRDRDLGFALKMDDGSIPHMNGVVVELLFRLKWIDRNEYEALDAWTDKRVFNDAGREVGHREVV